MEQQILNTLRIQEQQADPDDIADSIIDVDVLYLTDTIALNAKKIKAKLTKNERKVLDGVIIQLNNTIMDPPTTTKSEGMRQVIGILQSILYRDE